MPFLKIVLPAAAILAGAVMASQAQAAPIARMPDAVANGQTNTGVQQVHWRRHHHHHHYRHHHHRHHHHHHRHHRYW